MPDAITIRFTCLNCGKQLSTTAKNINRRIKCPACSQITSVEASKSGPSDDSISSDKSSIVQVDTINVIRSQETEVTADNLKPDSSERKPIKRFGRFELKQLLGQGAFGRVYKAYDLCLPTRTPFELNSSCMNDSIPRPLLLHKVDRYPQEPYTSMKSATAFFALQWIL
jgi:transcription elongation factor Elf1